MKVRVIRRPPYVWMRWLFLVHIVALLSTFAGRLPIQNLSFGLSLFVLLGTICCLKNLEVKNPRYKKAGVFLLLSLVMLFVNRLLPNSLVSLISSVLSLIAVYQEYAAHAEVAAPHDGRLARTWRSLFVWEIIIGVVASMFSTVAILALTMLEMDAARMTMIISGALTVVNALVKIVYLSCVNKMVPIVSK